MTNTPLRQAFCVRDGMESFCLQEPAATTESRPPLASPKSCGPYSPESKAVVVRNTCDKNFTGERDPSIKMDINSLTPFKLDITRNSINNYDKVSKISRNG